MWSTLNMLLVGDGSGSMLLRNLNFEAVKYVEGGYTHHIYPSGSVPDICMYTVSYTYVEVELKTSHNPCINTFHAVPFLIYF